MRQAKIEFTEPIIKYINHAIGLSHGRNYFTSMKWMDSLGRLMDLKRWISSNYDMITLMQIATMVLLNEKHFKGCLPDTRNLSYNTSLENFERIMISANAVKDEVLKKQSAA